LLKCTSAYPSDEKEANILTMQDMSSRYGCQVGLSDHTLRPYAAYAAVALGASVIEKHVTLSRTDGGVDPAFSLEPAELRGLVEGTEVVWLSRGNISSAPSKIDETSLNERPSIYLVHPLKQGAQCTKDNTSII